VLAHGGGGAGGIPVAGLVKYDERFQLARGFPHYSPQDLASAFEGLVVDPDHFVWKGIEIFCGRKP
jgi:hypothetical protein